MFVSGPATGLYTIAATTNIGNPQWSTLFTTNPAAMPFIFTDTTWNSTQKFYRVWRQ